jgi:hypothetical protein
MSNEVFPNWKDANQELEKLTEATFIYPAFSKPSGQIAINLFFVDEKALDVKIPQGQKKKFENILVALTQKVIQKVGLNVIGMAYRNQELTGSVREMMARDAISRFKKYSEDHDLKDFLGRRLRKRLGLPVEDDAEYTIRLAWEDEEK